MSTVRADAEPCSSSNEEFEASEEVEITEPYVPATQKEVAKQRVPVVDLTSIDNVL